MLDQDLYKLSMQQATFLLYPDEDVEYQLFCRDKIEFPLNFAKELKTQIKKMESLSLLKEEKDFLSQKCPYLKRTYLDFLSGYRYNSNEVNVEQKGSGINVKVTGPWYRTILWEVPLMAMISELFYKMTYSDSEQEIHIKTAKKRIKQKASYLVDAHAYAEFGTRRRYSFHTQDIALKELITNKSLVGTSNLYFAKKYNIKPIGTQAHEWFMFHAAKYGFTAANSLSLEKWIDIYQGELGIALPDTFTTNVFLRSFTTKYAKLFDGVRQDSGDPIAFAKSMIQHYNKLNIDPLSKTIAFSDGINHINQIQKIGNFCCNKIKYSFGIGTWLTNDVGVPSLNMVIKMTKVKSLNGSWVNTCKLSDSTGKHTGEKETIALCKKTLMI